jgi:hypothetical protein
MGNGRLDESIYFLSPRTTSEAIARVQPRSAMILAISGFAGLPPRSPFSLAASAFAVDVTLPALRARLMRSRLFNLLSQIEVPFL